MRLYDRMRRGLVAALVLLLCSTAWAANNFSSDGNCKAVWNVDNGALTTDSKGTNTLTNSGVTNDTGAYKEGDASADFNALSDILYCFDANLDAGFPLKNGDANKKISICGWFKVDAFPSSANRTLAGKYNVTTNGRSFLVFCKKVTTWRLAIGIGYNSGNSVEEIPHASTIQTGRWYHYGITYQDSDKSYRIRIWDDTAGAILGSDLTGTASNNIYVGSTPSWFIGTAHNTSSCLDCRQDEIVVTDDILTTGEIDQIRAGTYGAAAKSAAQVIIVGEDE